MRRRRLSPRRRSHALAAALFASLFSASALSALAAEDNARSPPPFPDDPAAASAAPGSPARWRRRLRPAGPARRDRNEGGGGAKILVRRGRWPATASPSPTRPCWSAGRTARNAPTRFPRSKRLGRRGAQSLSGEPFHPPRVARRGGRRLSDSSPQRPASLPPARRRDGPGGVLGADRKSSGRNRRPAACRAHVPDHLDRRRSRDRYRRTPARPAFRGAPH